MLVKVLGGIDAISGMILIFYGMGFEIQNGILLFFSAVLIFKSMIGFLKDFASWIDFLSGMSVILTIFFPAFVIIEVIFGILVLQKGIFSFL